MFLSFCVFVFRVVALCVFAFLCVSGFLFCVLRGWVFGFLRFTVSCFVFVFCGSAIAVILAPYARVMMFSRPPQDVIYFASSAGFSFWVVGDI